MKKYVITTAIALTAITGVFAEGQEGRRMMATTTRAAMVMPASQGIMMSQPTITTGDAATDAQIKALQTEMEAKIKAIRDEYQAKIKAVIGDRKVKTGNGEWMRASSTRMDMRKGSSTMIHHNENESEHEGMMNGSGTPVMRGEGRGEGNRVPREGMVKGESTEAPGASTAEFKGGVRGFFGRLFGR